MISVLENARTIAGTEFKIEWRNPGACVSTALFSLLALLTQALAFPTHLAARPDIAFAAFFVSAFFAALLAENARIGREIRTGIPSALALARTGSLGVYLGKTAASFGLMCLLQAALLPFLILFFNLPPVPQNTQAFLLWLLAGLACAFLITLLGPATLMWRGIGGALGLPILILPLALPVLAAVSIGTAAAWTGRPAMPYLKLLLAAALAFGTVGSLTYGRLLGRK